MVFVLWERFGDTFYVRFYLFFFICNFYHFYVFVKFILISVDSLLGSLLFFFKWIKKLKSKPFCMFIASYLLFKNTRCYFYLRYRWTIFFCLSKVFLQFTACLSIHDDSFFAVTWKKSTRVVNFDYYGLLKLITHERIL